MTIKLLPAVAVTVLCAVILSACIGLKATVTAPPAPTLGPYSTAINIALNLAGKSDPNNPGTAADSFASKVLFHPPAGYNTRILHVDGDFVAWPMTANIPAGTSTEVGFGLKTTAPDGSTRVTYPGYSATPYDNSWLWLQGALVPQAPFVRLPISIDTHVGGLLGPDNIMLAQSFVALNSTGLSVHIEPTIVVIYAWEHQ